MRHSTITAWVLGPLFALVDPGCAFERSDTSADPAGPTITITSADHTDTADYTLTGTVHDDDGVATLGYTLDLDPSPVPIPIAEQFSTEVTLDPGPNVIRVWASDTAGNQEVTAITVNAVIPSVPVAADQTVRLDEDTPAEIALEADNADGRPLRYEVVDQPARGALSGRPSLLTYVPDPDYHGADAFTFRAWNGAVASNLATVSITITPINDAPVAMGAAITATQDNPVAFTLEATDVDGDALEITVTAGPSNGTLDTSGLPNVVYTPHRGFSGLDSLTFRVHDGLLEDSATVDFTVYEGTVIYVDGDQGDDNNDGLSPERAKRTLAAAIAAADRPGPEQVPDQIALASGRYCVAGLRIDRSLVLVGAGIGLTLLDGSAAESDCAGAPTDAGRTLPEICGNRPARGWPSDGVIRIGGDTAAPLEVTIADLSIINGYTDGFGGGIENREALILERVRLEGNCAGRGGGLYNAPRSDLPAGAPASQWGRVLLIDSDVLENAAETGGGIFNAGSMQVSSTTIALNEAFAIDPQAQPSTGIPIGWGGGVFVGIPDTPIDGLEIGFTGSVVNDNTAWGSGGGLASVGAGFTVDGTSFDDNRAGSGDEPGSGGGMLAIGNGAEPLPLALRDATFNRNQASSEGGGLSITYFDLQMIRSQVLDNSARDGGGAMLLGIAPASEAVGPSNAAVIAGCQLAQNVATGAAGGLWADRIDLQIEGSTISDNRAPVAGGALLAGGAATVEGSMIVGNAATAGGGLWVEVDADVTLLDSDISRNQATREAAGIYSAGALTIEGCTMLHNDARATAPGCNPERDTPCDPDSVGHAQVGGAILSDHGNLALFETRLDNNTAADAGAGIYMRGGAATIERSAIAANRAEDRGDHNGPVESGGDGGRFPEGGGIFLGDGGHLQLTDADVSGNVAEVRGGGLFAESGSVEMTGAVFAANKVEANEGAGLAFEIQCGGGIYSAVDATIADSYFVDNSSSDWGGGICAPAGTVSVERSTFATNRAVSSLETRTDPVADPDEDAVGEGGAIWLSAARLELFNSTLSGNEADERGSAVRIVGGEAILGFTTVYDNAAGREFAALSGGSWIAESSIIAGSGLGSNCQELEMTAELTLAGDESCFSESVGGSNLPSTQPLLAPLGNYGGRSPTHLPLRGSPVLDAVPEEACEDPSHSGNELEVDQRGLPRPVDGDGTEGALCDIGAVERQPSDTEPGF